ncbi:MAG: thiamine pyrophosphate-requiring protein [Burkholderiaceae bacterium]|nr:thiamine pyrophosphate-requiring protein [Burkholderiaceae bacterium]
MAVETVAEAILEILRVRGVDYVFGNSSTSVIDAFAKSSASQGMTAPRPVMTPHEQVAVAMAHGAYIATGRVQAVFVYSTVGTANALSAIINASRARVPILVFSTRTAVSDNCAVRGARDTHVHWSQESFDQGAMVREFVKWDYELRTPDQIEEIVDRAIEVALADPPGPVYLSLPRDLLALPMSGISLDIPSRRMVASRRFPDPQAIEAAADILSAARKPLVVTAELGRDPSAVAALVELCDAAALPVLEASPLYANFPAAHPCHAGYVFGTQVYPGLADADAILVIDCDVPWLPSRTSIAEAAQIIQLGVEPFYTAYPTRSFRCDLPLVADPQVALPLLAAALRRRIPARDVEARLKQRRLSHAELRTQWSSASESERTRPSIGFQWASRCVSELADDRTIVVNEYPLDLRHAPPRGAGSYFGASHAGGLGWGFGAALGAKLVCPDHTVIATLGDGSYFFAVPSACHQVAMAQNLPLLVVVFNNGGWDEVAKSTLSAHPNGWAATTKHIPMVRFDPSPRFERIVEAFEGYGERVEVPAELPDALRRALKVVREQGKQALVNIVCQR